VSIEQVPAPVVNAAAISGSVGTPLSFTPSVTASNPVTLSLSGAPAGMMLSATGAVSWSSPVAGTYKVTVLAKDTKTGLSGRLVDENRVAGCDQHRRAGAGLNGEGTFAGGVGGDG
jgi:hypothetical protein